jgi:hypothetical protein
MPRIPQYLLSLAGEYRVCSELNRRRVFATVTYGNRKSVDVYAISDRRERALKIEVKTSQQGNFVTKITQKFTNKAVRESRTKITMSDLVDDHAPDFWVLVQMQVDGNESFGDRFFVMTHHELCEEQLKRNDSYAEKYLAKHGTRPDQSKGIDNLLIDDVEQFEDQWDKIVGRLGGAEEGDSETESAEECA